MSAVASAKSFLAPPFTPRRLIIACFSILGIASAYSLKPDALLNTPALLTSGTLFPDTFDLCKSLSPLNVDPTNCLIMSPCENLPSMFANLAS